MGRESLIEKLKNLFRRSEVKELEVYFKVDVKKLSNIKLNYPKLLSEIDIKKETNCFNVGFDGNEIAVFNSHIEESSIDVYHEEYKNYKDNLNVFSVNTEVKSKSFRMPFEVSGVDTRTVKISNIKKMFRTLGYKRLVVKLYLKGIKALKYGFTPNIKDNTVFARSFPIKRKSFPLYELPKEKQVSMLKAIVLTSKRKPKEIKIIGYFPELPFSQIENIKVDYKKSTLEFKVKSETAKKNIRKGAVFYTFEDSDKISMVFWG